jgi:fatty-acyl-CoA synthase
MINTKKIPSAQNAYSYPLLIKNILAQSLKFEANREIVYRDLKRYNYHDLNRRIRKLANVLSNLGIKGGETVAVIDYDSHRYLECFFAIPMIGAVLHTINFRLSPEQILYTANHAEDIIILTHTDFLPLVEGIVPHLKTVKQVILLSDTGHLPHTNLPHVAGEYENLLAREPDEYDFPDFDEDSVATTFYTTGTTGNPKGVFFTHRQLVLHTIAGAVALGAMDSACRFRSNDVYMPITPMFHVHAWGIPYLATMLGVKQVYPGRYEPEMLLRLLLSEKVTFSHCVPTILQMLVSSPAASKVDLSNWKVIIGGSALPAALAKAALSLGIDIITGYGMSETCPIMSLTYLNPNNNLSLDEQVAIRTKAGIPIHFSELRILNENDKFLPFDGFSVGEVVARTPWLTQGYFKEPQKSEDLWRVGYLHTGDVGSIDDHNTLKISDRIKDVIKTGGEWVSSIDIENILSLHPAIAEAAVVGIPDPKWGERPHALLSLRTDKQTNAEEIRSYMEKFVSEGKISRWAVPDSIRFATVIPKTSVGKIDKKRIRAEWEE